MKQTAEYVIITPARNEEEHIERIIRSMIKQTVKPVEWVIVNDGSTDRTQKIINFFAEKHSFIRLLDITRSGDRNFAAKSLAFRAGCEHVKSVTYKFIGNLDADVSFEDNYFENILAQFCLHPRLGIAGGVILEPSNGRFIPQRISTDSVAGAIQMFRRECFEDVGGYMPLRAGAIDAVAEIMARSHGWEVMTLPKFPVKHHRPVGRGMGSVISLQFRQGVTFYQVGYHPLFYVLKSFYKLIEKPYIATGMALLSGYLWACFMRYRTIVPENVMQFLRKEQKAKLRSMFMSPFRHH